MRLDTSAQAYTEAVYEEYIYGSAEVVGLLSLSIFCKGDTARQEQLSPGARALGAAFQKVNFLRDIGADLSERGRIYFPNVVELPLTLEQKRAIQADIEKDFAAAHSYVGKLPLNARKAVRLAYAYYSALFAKLKKRTPQELMQRQRVSNAKKLALLAGTFVARKR